VAIISWKREGTVAVLSMDNGENRQNPAFVEAFLGAMNSIEADQEAHALVIVSSDVKNWTQGLDLEWIIPAFGDPARHDEVRGLLRGLNDVSARCLTYPMPVIAAITGHTFGNGVVLACACDFRFMRSDRGFFCLPEVDINIPLLPGMQAVIEKALPAYWFNEMYLTGRRITGKELEEHHVVVKSCMGTEPLLKEAMTFAATLHKGREVFGEMKRRKYRHILEVFRNEDIPIIESLRVLP
jgi:enoyl-CoA hydratase/carnithine racemase